MARLHKLQNDLPALRLRPSADAGKAALVMTRNRETATPETAVPVTTACMVENTFTGMVLHAGSRAVLHKTAKRLQRCLQGYMLVYMKIARLQACCSMLYIYNKVGWFRQAAATTMHASCNIGGVCITCVYLGGRRATSPKIAPCATPSHSPTKTTKSRMTDKGDSRTLTASSCSREPCLAFF